MPHAALWPNLAWWAAQAPGYRRFRAALDRPRAVQGRVLSRIVGRNADSIFGRAHDFRRIRSVEDFRNRVPLSAYDDYAQWIERIMAGEPGVLTREPVLRLMPTSGSTAPSKLVPYTATLQREFRAAIAPWICDLYRHRLDLLAGPSYWSISPAIPPSQATSAVPIGYDSDTAYLGGFGRRLADLTLAVPAAVSRIRGVKAFRQATLTSLLSARELRLISVWHPSFLTLMLDHLEPSWDRLLGALGDPKRVAELRACGPRAYSRIWPRLGLISCWTEGSAGPQVDTLHDAFPSVRIQPKGLIATEAFISLPWGAAMPAAVGSHFFEFLSDGDRTHLLHELQVGGVYSVVVTTGGGLYRYRMRDRIEVTSFVGRTPSLRFLGKEDHVADAFGEKLSEGFVRDVLNEVFGELALRPLFAMLARESDEPGTCYTLFVETDREPPADIATKLESALRRNPHYDHCIALGQLTAARVFRIEGAGGPTYFEHCGRRSQRLGDIKPVSLSVVPGWATAFQGRYLPAPEHLTRRIG